MAGGDREQLLDLLISSWGERCGRISDDTDTRLYGKRSSRRCASHVSRDGRARRGGLAGCVAQPDHPAPLRGRAHRDAGRSTNRYSDPHACPRDPDSATSTTVTARKGALQALVPVTRRPRGEGGIGVCGASVDPEYFRPRAQRRRY
jgi:hypothetical protein